MTREEIERFIQKNPITYNAVKVAFSDGSSLIGFFENGFGDSEELKENNLWRFIENNNAAEYKRTKNAELTTIIKGKNVIRIKKH